jgi:hypothetical protein
MGNGRRRIQRLEGTTTGDQPLDCLRTEAVPWPDPQTVWPLRIIPVSQCRLRRNETGLDVARHRF